MSDIQEAIKTLKEAGVEVSAEELLAALQLTNQVKLEKRHISPFDAGIFASRRPRVWFRIQCGFFETVVSYVHATTIEEAINYAASSHCEWYRIRDVSDETFYGASFETTQLNHDQFNQWCAKMWPGTAVSDTQQST